MLEQPREPLASDSQRGSLLGPRFSDAFVRRFLDEIGATYHELPDDHALCERTAELLAAGNVVGWLQGRMEFGPRALGSRSILGDARDTNMQSALNLKIKFRESFRPFAPAVLKERVHEYFEMRPGQDSPYMLLVAPLREQHRLPLAADAAESVGLDKLKRTRSTITAVTHVDYSARVQTVDRERHGRYHALLQAFERRTGCAVLVNTSFNVRGEPIVCTPADAYRCFRATDMDALVLERYVLLKHEQPALSESDAESARQMALD